MWSPEHRQDTYDTYIQQRQMMQWLESWPGRQQIPVLSYATLENTTQFLGFSLPICRWSRWGGISMRQLPRFYLWNSRCLASWLDPLNASFLIQKVRISSRGCTEDPKIFLCDCSCPYKPLQSQEKDPTWLCTKLKQTHGIYNVSYLQLFNLADFFLFFSLLFFCLEIKAFHSLWWFKGEGEREWIKQFNTLSTLILQT